MKEIPILFSSPMVRAILDGRKTQTRRIIFPRTDYTLFSQPTFEGLELDPTDSIRYDKEGYAICDKISDEPKLYALKGLWALFEGDQFYEDCAYIKSPYGQPGDILWVRETFFETSHGYIIYKATPKKDLADDYKWKPSIFMPKEACRIKLLVKNVRVERLQDISEEDAIAEGVKVFHSGNQNFNGKYYDYSQKNRTHTVADNLVNTAKESYISLWESINGKGSWEKNPWVWVIEFERLNEQIAKL